MKEKKKESKQRIFYKEIIYNCNLVVSFIENIQMKCEYLYIWNGKALR